MFKEWLFVLMGITCKDISPVISEMTGNSALPEKYWRAKIHLAMCGVCRYYKNQLNTMMLMANELANSDSSAKIDSTLCSELKIPFKQL